MSGNLIIENDIAAAAKVPCFNVNGVSCDVRNKDDDRLDLCVVHSISPCTAAGVFTKNLDQATKASNQLEAGQIYVNSWFTGSVATPFGGYKKSGYSREKGQEAIKGYLQVKNVGIQL